MATQPITCPYTTPPGFIFYKGDLVLQDSTSSTPQIYMGLRDFMIDIQSFSKMRVNLKAQKNFLLSQTAIADDLGYVTFIAVKVIFPSDTIESNKYLTWTYEGATYPMGELLILSGPRLSAENSVYGGWFLSKPSQYSNTGGIVFTNAHTDIDVKLEILVAK